jgi:outer membrane protein assembly factor BamD
MKIRFSAQLFLILLSPVLFLGCASLEEDPTINWSAEELYTNAKSRLDDKFYDQSIELYKNLDLRYPYGPFAEQGKIDIAYAYWKMNNSASALMACDRFIREHPDHENVDYVMYLKALVHFNDDKGLLGFFVSKNLAERDPGAAREAFDILRDLVKRFPDSRYAEDAQLRMAYLVNTLAEHEVSVANYYFRRGAFVASINRAQSVIENYPRAPAAREALEVLALSYERSGLVESKQKIEAIIDVNFPGLRQVKTEDAERSWWEFWGNKTEDDSHPEGSDQVEGKSWWKFWIDDGMPPEDK